MLGIATVLWAALAVANAHGFLVGQPNLSPSDAVTFNGMAGKLKLAQ